MVAPFIIAGFSIGILGSFHCVGMCGPIALALPVADAGKWQRLWYISLYNTGRVLAYASLGILFGLLGKQFFIGDYQRYLSIALGVLILFFLLFSNYLNRNNVVFSQYTLRIKQILGKLLNGEKHFYTYLLIGFFNGYLPCGLVYVAIAGALAAGTITNSLLFMAAFGLGTFPVMFMVTVLGKFISVQWRNQMRKAVPVFVGMMAVLLILRGLNLGIPYISPEMKATESGTHSSCCHKE